MRLVLLVHAWLAVQLLLGCETRVSLGGACRDESSCTSGLRCRYGRCRAECAAAADCTGGAICIGEPGVCTVALDDCDRECAPGLVCAGTRCTTGCTTAGSECRPGSSCVEVSGVRGCVVEDAADAGLDTTIDGTLLDAATPTMEGRRMCAGYGHACAVRGDRVYCWGSNDAGELGDGLSTSDARDHAGLCGSSDCAPRPDAPVRRREGTGTAELTGVTALACGRLMTCALTTTGAVFCWGSVENGFELGHDGLGRVAQPTIRAGASALTLGLAHGCARVDDHYECWGVNDTTFDGGMTHVESGVLGSPGPSTATARRATRFDGARFVTAGGSFTCATFDTEVVCVGTNFAGELGLSTETVDATGRPIDGLVHPVEAIHATGHAACALAAGDVRCWGWDAQSFLASEALPPACDEWSRYGYRCRTTAGPVHRELGLEDESFVGISVGQSSSACAITAADRSVLCWGGNELGQAGVDSDVYGVGILAQRVEHEGETRLVDVAEVACGAAFCCARTIDDRVFCWGENDLGQLGNGTTDSVSFDADVPDGGGPAAAAPHPRAAEVLFP